MIAYPLAAGGIRTRVLQEGTGDKTMVFAHGLGARAAREAPRPDHYAEIPDSGHAPYFERPEAFNAMPLDFLAASARTR